MTQLAEIQLTQSKLEETFIKRMAELEAQLHTGGSAKDTVAKVAEEFRSFRELMFNMLRLLRQQVTECSRLIEMMETRHRRKVLVFHGVKEMDKEDAANVILNILHTKLGLTDISSSSIRVRHRIGGPSKEHQRPILVWFAGVESRVTVWRAKAKLKGSTISVKEFLTKSRQAIFGKARQDFGMRACWSQNGVIMVKVTDGGRRKITTMDELQALTRKYPKMHGESSAAGVTGEDCAGMRAASSKPRKN